MMKIGVGVGIAVAVLSAVAIAMAQSPASQPGGPPNQSFFADGQGSSDGPGPGGPGRGPGGPGHGPGGPGHGPGGPGHGPGGPGRGPGFGPPMMMAPPSKGAEFRMADGSRRVFIKCADDDSTKQCMDAVGPILNKLIDNKSP